MVYFIQAVGANLRVRPTGGQTRGSAPTALWSVVERGEYMARAEVLETAKVGVPHDAQMLRLKRIEGQIRGVQKMIEERRYCVDIITQLQSISAAIAGVQELVLKKHLEHCVTEAMRSGREEDKREKIDEIITILKNFGR